MTEDFYDLLELPSDASQEDIKDAYREKVRIYHPDLNDDDRAQAQFVAVKKAYEILSEPVERQAYDRLGHKDYVAKRTSGIPDPEVWASSDDDSSTSADSSTGTSSSSRSSSGSSSGTSSDSRSNSRRTTKTTAGRSSTSTSTSQSGSTSGAKSGESGRSGSSRNRTKRDSSSSSRNSRSRSSSTSSTDSTSGSGSSRNSSSSSSSRSRSRSRSRSSTSSAGSSSNSSSSDSSSSSRRRSSGSESDSSSSSSSRSRTKTETASASTSSETATTRNSRTRTQQTSSTAAGRSGGTGGTASAPGTADSSTAADSGADTDSDTDDSNTRFTWLRTNPLARWWRRQRFGLALLWLSVLVYLAGLADFALGNETGLESLRTELAAVGTDPAAIWGVLESGRYGIDTGAVFVQRSEIVTPPVAPMEWYAALGGFVALVLGAILVVRLGWREETWRPLSIDETILLAIALGISTTLVGGPLLAGAVLMPFLFTVIVAHTRRGPGWTPSYAYVLPVLGPLCGFAAGLAGYATLPADLVVFVVLPLLGALGLPLRATIRKHLGR